MASKTYNVYIRFFEPCESNAYVMADSEEEAIEKAEKLFGNRQGVEIVFCEECGESQLMMDFREMMEEAGVPPMPMTSKKDLN